MLSALRAHQMPNRPLQRRWKHRGPKPAKPLPRKAVWSIRRVEIGEAKRKFQMKGLGFITRSVLSRSIGC